MKYNDYVSEFSEKIISALKAGTAPWQKPWKSNGGLPRNAITSKEYKGGNVCNLMLQSMICGYSDSRWVTYKQAQTLGGHVKKGEKSTPAIHWSIVEEEREDGTIFSHFIPNVFYLFNVEQCEGLKLKTEEKQSVFTPIESAEKIIKASKANIFHGSQSSYYNPKTDEIHVPNPESFIDTEHYYDTLIHELGHWTGAESRLNRDLKNSFGTPDYAREELRAQIASMMIGHTIGLNHDDKNTMAYVDSWIKAIEKDPKEIMKACNDAEKIKDYLLNLQ